MNRIKKLYICVHEKHNSYGYMYNAWSKHLDTAVYGNVQVTYIAINSWGITILVFTLYM